MTDLDEMWQELARYQVYADRHGFGSEWRQMREKLTPEAAWSAAWAAREASNVAAAAARRADVARRATRNIRDAIEKEDKT